MALGFCPRLSGCRVSLDTHLSQGGFEWLEGRVYSTHRPVAVSAATLAQSALSLISPLVALQSLAQGPFSNGDI